jgi:MSHA biogenesis protein MshJ
MKGRLERWALRFDALSLRERAAIFAAVAVLFVFLANTFLIERQSASSSQLKLQIENQKQQISNYEVQANALQQAKAMDLDAVNRERLQHAQQELSQLEMELASAQKGLVSAEHMPALLQDVLRQQHGLQLVELRTLPVTPLVERTAKDDKAAPAADAAVAAGATPGTGSATAPAAGQERNLYKHGFEVTVRGSYPDFVQYLAQLERLPTRMYWGKVTMNADDYPRVTLTATIYTLSLDKAWLAV